MAKPKVESKPIETVLENYSSDLKKFKQVFFHQPITWPAVCAPTTNMYAKTQDGKDSKYKGLVIEADNTWLYLTMPKDGEVKRYLVPVTNMSGGVPE
jgi:hypothetical protein